MNARMTVRVAVGALDSVVSPAAWNLRREARRYPTAGLAAARGLEGLQSVPEPPRTGAVAGVEGRTARVPIRARLAGETDLDPEGDYD